MKNDNPCGCGIPGCKDGELCGTPPRRLIVTRHKPLVEWLKSKGVVAPVIEQADEKDVYGKDVYGILPLHLASKTNRITEVSMPKLTLEQRKKNAAGDLTIEEMNEAGAHLRKFIVCEESAA